MSTQVEPRPAVAGPTAPALSASRPAAEADTGAPAKPRRGSPAPIIVAVAALVLVAVFVRQWLVSRGTVSTDNAQVAGHVVPVLPRVSGMVTDVRVVENQPVHEGDVLVKIDDRDWQVRLAMAEADLQKEVANAGANGRVGQSMAQLAGARANLEQARAADERAQSDLQRMQTLASRNIVSVQQLDAAQAAARASAAQVQAGDELVVAAEAALRGADAKVASARAARDQAALQLSYTRWSSPDVGRGEQEERRGGPAGAGRPAADGGRAARRRVGRREPQGDRDRGRDSPATQAEITRGRLSRPASSAGTSRA